VQLRVKTLFFSAPRLNDSYDGIDTDPMIACQSPRRAPSPAFFSRQINIHHSIPATIPTGCTLQPAADNHSLALGSGPSGWLY